MGAKTWMLVYADTDARGGAESDTAIGTERQPLAWPTVCSLVEKLISIGDGDLSYTCPPDGEIHIGAFVGVSIVAAKEFGIDYPSKLAQRFLAAGACRTMYLHAMHSVVDWFAFAQRNNGRLVRSLSLAPDSGLLEDIGQRLPFEEPYWSGNHPAVDDEDEYPFPFHPLDLGEAALKEFFGYQLEGRIDPTLLEPESIPLIRYKRTGI